MKCRRYRKKRRCVEKMAISVAMVLPPAAMATCGLRLTPYHTRRCAGGALYISGRRSSGKVKGRIIIGYAATANANGNAEGNRQFFLCYGNFSQTQNKKKKLEWVICRSSSSRRHEDGTRDEDEDEDGVGVQQPPPPPPPSAAAPAAQWLTSFLLFLVWGGLICYAVFLSPDQTPGRDFYFIQKLSNLKGDDGFRMNTVLVSLWYMMGVWPFVYSMLLLPTARSSQRKVPLWPFLVLSMFGGAFALMPYFILWRPPAPAVESDEMMRLPLRIFDSKIMAVTLLVGGLLLITNALLAGDSWSEFWQYFIESKLVHITSIDFSLLSSFAPFWAYNDMTVRGWFKNGKWLLPLTLVPIIGPALYLSLRPSLQDARSKVKQTN